MSAPYFFDTVKRSYEDVPVTDQGVETMPFLEATEDLVRLFDVFGSSAFGIVQKDMTGNIAKIKERALASPGTSATLEDLVKGEKAEKKTTATQGLLWLLRGLDFTAQGLRHNLSNENAELATSFTEAYGNTLKKHHSFVIRPVFSLAMKACPYRKDFYPKLAATPEEVDQKIQPWLSSLETIVSRMQKFYDEGYYGKGL